MESLDLNISGLYTNVNPFSAAPPGALSAADNMVIDRPSIAESRRGQAKYATLTDVPNKGFDYKGYFLVNYGSRMAVDTTGTGSFTNYSGAFDPPATGVKIRSFEENQNLYLTTLRGVLKLDTPLGSFRSAGAIKALEGTYSLVNPGFMSDQVQIAYRMVWGYKDANENEIVGAPSQRLIVINDTGDTANVALSWQIPSGIDTTWFYRVYRSGESAGLEFPPDDELQQVKEGIPTSAQISAGFITFTDIVVNGMRGATLYTSQSQQGILQANEPPPFALDIAAFRNCAFYFNTIAKQRLVFTLVSVGNNSTGGQFGYQTGSGHINTNTTISAITGTASVAVQDLTYTAAAAGVAGNDISITYIGGATAGSEVVQIIDTTNIVVSIEDGVSTATQIKATIDSTPNPATKVIADLTYTAVTQGAAGNDISIEYFPGGTAGAEVVVVDGKEIRVKLDTGVSTATQVHAAVVASVPASALVTCTITGTGSNTQVTTAQTFLAGGDDNALGLITVAITGISSAPQFVQDLTFLNGGLDTTTLHVGMRVIGTNIPTGAKIVSIDSSSSITISAAATATATESITYQDIFRINANEYYAGSANDFTNHVFKVVLDGSPEENVYGTILNLIQAINQDTRNTALYAYESSAAGFVGTILLEERGIGGGGFAITSTYGASFNPTLANTGTANQSDNDAAQNRVMISKPQQPEAVPILQYINVGSENYPIVRALANRDGIFIFKPGEGIFRLSGTSITDFTVSLFNSSAQIKVPESAVILNDNVFCFSDQGIIKVSENGVDVVSIPIEKTLLQISSPQFTNFEAQSFGVSYESDRKYIFCTVTDPLDEVCTQAFVYNALTNSFTRWIMTRSFGIVLKSDNKLYMGDPETNFIFQERKNYDRYDYCDQSFPVIIIAVSGNTLQIIDETLAVDSSTFAANDNTGWTDTNTDGTITIANDEKTYARNPPGAFNHVGSVRNGIPGKEGLIFQWNFKMPAVSVGGQNTNVLFGLRDDASLAVTGTMIYMLVNNNLGEPLNVQTFPSGTRANITAEEVYTGKLVVGVNEVAVYISGGPEEYQDYHLGTGPHAGIQNATIRFNVNVASIEAGELTFDDYFVLDPDAISASVEVGNTIKQGGPESVISEVLNASTIVVDDLYDWQIGEATIYQPIRKALQWVPVTGDNAGVLKHYSECTIIFDDASFKSIDVGFQSNLDDGFDFVTVSELIGQGWGKFPWGLRPWGIAGGRPEPVRTYVSLEKQRASWVNFRVENAEAFSNFALAGISTQFEVMSSRFR